MPVPISTYRCPIKYFIKSLFAVFCFVLSFGFSTSNALSDVPRDSVLVSQKYYERGLEKTNTGKLTEGLSIWEEAKGNLTDPDFRISQSYLNIVVLNKLKGKYIKAIELYYWGLNGKIMPEEEVHLLNELKYLQPLIGEKKFRNLKKKIERGDSSALAGIKEYWKEKDLTPLSEYNERIIEHWERINFINNNFEKKSSDKLDDRANTYLKYGSPNYKKEGQLNYSGSLVSRLVKEGIQLPSFASSNQIAVARSQRMSMENRVRSYHSYPRYEIWIYNDISTKGQNTIFLYGTRNGTSSFRKINAIEDFIPSQAYRTIGQNNYSFQNSRVQDQNSLEDRESVRSNTLQQSSQQVSKVDFSAALILQLMYYEQFAALDPFFGRTYNLMMDRFVSESNTLRNGLSREFETLYGNKMQLAQEGAFSEHSSYKNSIPNISSKNYSYRYLNDNNDPYIKFYSLISIKNAVYYDLLKDENSLDVDISGRYTLKSGIKSKSINSNNNSSWNRDFITKLNTHNTISSLVYEDVDNVFFYYELHKTANEFDSVLSENSVFPKSLIGIGNSKIDIPEPLENSSLVLSDLIIGYNYEQNGYSLSEDNLTSFKISHERTIPTDKELNLYYEVYNLSPIDSTGNSEYTFKYSIRGQKRGFLGIGKKKGKEVLSISIKNTVTGTRDKQTLIINTSNYQAGNYTLVVTVSDINSGKSYQREQVFRIE